MNIRQSLLAQAVILGATGLYSAIVAPTLPKVVPTHWGVSGKADAYGSPAFALWFGPGMLALMMLLTWVLPKMSPKKFEIDRFEHTYSVLMLCVGLMMGAMHVAILIATTGKPIDIGRTIGSILGIFFMIFGNYLGKVRRNFFMGVRTPWTLASDRVWEGTHRQAGQLWFFGGLTLFILALLGAPIWVHLPVLLVLSFWPILHSYLLYQKLEGH